MVLLSSDLYNTYAHSYFFCSISNINLLRLKTTNISLNISFRRYLEKKSQ